MKLLISIPAFNEEASIEETIRSTLEARERILAETPVSSVTVTVISDGSDDKTAQIARRYTRDIRLIEFAENRGYGAAIQESWAESDADLLGFMDADGTCEPAFFVELCNKLIQEDLDLILGSRMAAGTEMPSTRRVGNFLFAIILSVFSSHRVTDTASGMRVVRREALPKLLPLPTGLHFTPAMSARAILGPNVRIAEIDMPYRSREGKSKLLVVRDGFLFLKVILKTAFLYRPGRPLAILSLICFFVAAALMLEPTLYYLRNRSVLEWMIYRFVVSHLMAVTALLLLSASYLTTKMVQIGLQTAGTTEDRFRFGRFLRSGFFWPFIACLVGFATILVADSFVELIRTGATYQHWSRFIAMSVVMSTGAILMVTRAIDYVLDLLASYLAYLRAKKVPVQVANQE